MSQALSTHYTPDLRQPFSATSQLPYRWSDTILIGILELSTSKNLPKDMSQALSTRYTPGCCQPFPCCHMDGWTQFSLVFLSSAPLKTYPTTCHKPYLEVILLTAASRFPAAIWMVGHNSYWYFWAQHPKKHTQRHITSPIHTFIPDHHQPFSAVSQLPYWWSAVSCYPICHIGHQNQPLNGWNKLLTQNCIFRPVCTGGKILGH